jgi:hypothetical protein
MAGGVRLLSAATAAGDSGEWNCLGLSGPYKLTVVATGTLTTTGDVVLYGAPSSGYGGTWEALTTPITPVEDTVITQTIQGPLHFVKANLDAEITGGGSVIVRLQPPVDWSE